MQKALKISPKSVKAATGMAKVYNKKEAAGKSSRISEKSFRESDRWRRGKKKIRKKMRKSFRKLLQIKEQIVAQEETGSREQNAENNTKAAEGIVATMQ